MAESGLVPAAVPGNLLLFKVPFVALNSLFPRPEGKKPNPSD